MKASIIISTYNAEHHLERVLWGFSTQSETDFEIIIADDGSSPKTATLIAALKTLFQIPITHIWQEDQGFRKCMILNKAIVASNTDYLIFTDGDCIPRKDFVAAHLTHRKKGHFLSGGYYKLPEITSQSIASHNITSQNCFQLQWLRQHGLKATKKLKITAKGFQAKLLNQLTPTKATWNGHNSSAWKKDILAINGFNNIMAYGGEDREFGERLIHQGIKPIQIRYSAVCVHLDHPKTYETISGWRLNNGIRAKTRNNKITVTNSGIAELRKKDSEDIHIRIV